MAITFNAATATATFADLFTDSESDNTWYRLWTGNAAGTDGDWVDTSSFNDYGNGWIVTGELASVDPDYAQGTAAQDTDLWVQTWNSTDGASSWDHGAVTFSDITDVQQTSQVQADTAFDQMFTDNDVSAAGTTWYQFWVGDASGAVGDWASTTYGNGWVTQSDMDTETFTAPADGESTELWVRSWNSTSTEFSGWEHWTVTTDAAPTLSVADASVTEGGTGTTAMTFTVTLSEAPGASEEVTVDYATSDGTATAGDDYAAASGTLTFAEGETEKTIDVTVNGDSTVENDETLTLTLSNVSGTISGDSPTISDAEAAGTITNDDSTGDVSVLTTGLDDYTGAEGNDAFYGVIDESTTANTTFQSYDRVDGGDGSNTFDLSLASNEATAAEYGGDASLDNIEIIKVKASGATDNTEGIFDADGLTGVTELMSNKSSDALRFDNIESLDTQISAYRISSSDGTDTDGNEDLQAIFKNSVASGTDDTVTVNLERVTDTDYTVEISTDGANGIENLTINSTGSDKNYLRDIDSEDSSDNAELKKVTVTGDQDLDMDENSLEFAGSATTDAATVDASAFTGDLDVDVDETTNLQMAVTGGTGDDNFDFGDSLDANDTVDGGDGTNTVDIDGYADDASLTLADYSLSNVEEVQIEGATGGDGDGVDLTIDSALTGLEELILEESQNNDDDIADDDDGGFTVTNLAAGVGVTLLNNKSDAGGNDGYNEIATVDLTLADATGTSDSLTVTLKGTAGDTAAENAVQNLTVHNVETLNLVSSHGGSTALGTSDDNTIDTITSDANLTTVNVSGSDELAMTVGSSATNLATFDATDTSTADNSYTFSQASDISVTTGSGDDTIAFGSNLNYNDTVDGGDHGSGSSDGDTVTATITGLTSTTGAFNISNVEKIKLTNAGTAVIDATNITGSTAINLDAVNDTTTFNNLSTDASVGLGFLGGSDHSIGTLTVGLADESGTDDSLTVSLNAVSSATLKATDIETVDFSLSTTDIDIVGATLTVSSLNAETITVAGADADTDSTLGLGTLDSDTTTLDASDYEGVLTAQLSSSATTVSLDGSNAHAVTGGAANDTMTVAATTAAQDVDGGSGTDTLNLTLGDGEVDGADIDNFEVFNISVSNNSDGELDLGGGAQEAINDNDTTTVNLTGGNSISTLTLGEGTQDGGGNGNDVIGSADGSLATGLTTIDASDLAAKMILTFGDDVLDSSLTVTGGSHSTDTIYAQYTGTKTPDLTDVEVLNIQTDGTSDIDFSNTTGLSKVTVDDDGAGATTTLTDLGSGVDVELTNAVAGTLTVDLDQKSASDNTLDLKLNTTGGASDINIADVETLTVDVDETATVDFAGLSMTTASETSVLNVEGDSDLTISALHADVTTIDASESTGALSMSARSATSAMTIDSSSGADTIIMKHADDALNSGSGNDTLDINFAAVLGGIGVDLSDTTDQVTTFNGSSNSAVQVGFTEVDLSGYAGSFGANITADSTGSTIKGTANADVITLGSGVDVVQAHDLVENASTVNVDNIASFTSTSDELELDISDIETLTAVTDLSMGDGTSLAHDSNFTLDEAAYGAIHTMDVATDAIIVITGSGSNYSSKADLIADIDAGGSTDLTWQGGDRDCSNEVFLALWSDGTDAYLTAIEDEDDAGNTAVIEDADLTATNLVKLTGVSSISSSDFVAGDFDFVA